MARQKGTANLAASLEVLAGAPLDSRTVVPTVADLTVAANFPYKYIGMPVVVQATGDMYVLTANDVTVSANWKKQSSSGGSGGHTIEDNGTAMTARAGLNFTDFDISDDSTNDETDVKAHRLTQEEMADIIYKIPSLADLSQMSTEATIFSTSEKVIGQWIDGKLLYQKAFSYTSQGGSIPGGVTADLATLPNTATVVNLQGVIRRANGAANTLQWINSTYPGYSSSLQYNSGQYKVQAKIGEDANYDIATILGYVQYTKTTDSPLAAGEKYAGLTSSGEVIYKRTVSVDTTIHGNDSWTTVVDVSSYNINTLIDAKAIVTYSGYTGTNESLNCLQLGLNASKRDLNAFPSRNQDVYIDAITIRYTKTS